MSIRSLHFHFKERKKNRESNGEREICLVQNGYGSRAPAPGQTNVIKGHWLCAAGEFYSSNNKFIISNLL